MAISAVGRRKFAAFGGIIVLDIVILALSICVNMFQGFFFVADLFPLLLSIITLAIFLISIVLELTTSNSFITRPVFEIPLLVVLTFIWLGFDTFSTSRWSNVLTSCSSIPDEYGDIRGWCKNLKALKVTIWLVWIALSILTSSLLYFAITHARRGDGQVWRTPLSRYVPLSSKTSSTQFVTELSSYYRGSSIFNFQFRTSTGTNGKGNSTPSSRDFFAPSPPVVRNSVASSAFGGGRARVGACTPPTFALNTQSWSPVHHERHGKDVFNGFEIVAAGSLENDVWESSAHTKW